MYIGANTTILANVTIESNVVIAAGSIVNKDVPKGKVVGGVPAKIIGNIEDLKNKRLQYRDIKEQKNSLKKEEILCTLWSEHENSYLKGR